jgi:cytidylate kinase
MVVAVDGPAGVGKSTVASRVASIAGFLYINSGLFYRAISKAVLDSGSDPNDSGGIVRIASLCRFSLHEGELNLDGSPVNGLQTDLIDRWSPVHSRLPQVRVIVNENLRRLAKSQNVIVEGRDIGTVTFPDAEIKIYLDADLEARAARRFRQGLSELSPQQVRQGLEQRDSLDRSKPIGRLEMAKDAIYIDTSHLTIEEVCAKVMKEIRKRQSIGSPDELRE